MTIYVADIVQGQTFFLELAVRDELGNDVDVSGTVKSVEVGNPIPEADFTLGGLTNIITVRSEETDGWPVGKYPLQVWLDWGDGADIENEPIFEAVISVRAKA